MDEPEFAEAPMLFIHPDECIDCGACVPACPVGAIFPGDEIPAGQELIVQANVTFYKNKEQAYALVKLHQAPKLATD
jgi:ferredoxin--NADP+ reductase